MTYLSKFALVLAIAALALPALAGAATPVEHWVPASHTADAITGEVIFSPTSIQFGNGAKLSLRFIGQQFGLAWMPGEESQMSDLYRVTVPRDLVLLRGNHFCGGHPVKYFTVVKTAADISVAAFQDEPSRGEQTLCATFRYLPK
jgi:hypothetical protein